MDCLVCIAPNPSDLNIDTNFFSENFLNESLNASVVKVEPNFADELDYLYGQTMC